MKIDSALTASLLGISRAGDRLSVRASRISEAFTSEQQLLDTPDASATKEPNQESQGDSVDLASEMVGLKIDQTAYKANLKALSVSSDLMKVILDIGNKKD